MALSNSKTTKAKRKQVSANAAWLKEQRGELAEMRADYKAFLTKHPEFKPAKKASKTVKTTAKVVCENDKFKSCVATIYSNPANPNRQKIVRTSVKKIARGGVNAKIKKNAKKVEKTSTRTKEKDGYYGTYYCLNFKKVKYTLKERKLVKQWYDTRHKKIAALHAKSEIYSNRALDWKLYETEGKKKYKKQNQLVIQLKEALEKLEHYLGGIGLVKHYLGENPNDGWYSIVWVHHEDEKKYREIAGDLQMRKTRNAMGWREHLSKTYYKKLHKK